jgi:hypothetical protein
MEHDKSCQDQQQDAPVRTLPSPGMKLHAAARRTQLTLALLLM